SGAGAEAGAGAAPGSTGNVIGGRIPGPSGSTTVVCGPGEVVVGLVGLVGLVVSPGPSGPVGVVVGVSGVGDVVVVVVVGVVVRVVRGASTLVRGTHV
ncbi:hypothetical protein EB74_32440, partial [Mycobacterium sp. SWH-M5]